MKALQQRIQIWFYKSGFLLQHILHICIWRSAVFFCIMGVMWFPPMDLGCCWKPKGTEVANDCHIEDFFYLCHAPYLLCFPIFGFGGFYLASLICVSQRLLALPPFLCCFSVRQDEAAETRFIFWQSNSSGGGREGRRDRGFRGARRIVPRDKSRSAPKKLVARRLRRVAEESKFNILSKNGWAVRGG